MFRFSVYKKSYSGLDVWLQHFKQVGEPAAILHTHEGFSIWRAGKEVCGAEDEKRLVQEQPPQDAFIVKSVNRFRV